jgi:plasmid maintenance system antidote protein VapI
MSVEVPLHPAETFARRLLLAVLGEMARFKQRDLAAMMGVSEARMSQIMSGRLNLSPTMMQRLLTAAEALEQREVDDER